MAKRKKRVVKSFGRKAWSYHVEPVVVEEAVTTEQTRAVRLAELGDILDELFPHGHADFNDITMSEMKLHSDKSIDYAAGSHPLGNFLRASKILSLYPRLNLSDPKVYALVLCMKQIDAVLWGFSEGHEQVVEGLDQRLADIGIYTKIVRCMMREKIGRQELPADPSPF